MAEEKKVSLKLLVDTKANKVLFAEADFVDFLFCILALPMGTIVKLLDKKDIVSSGSLGDLYKSIDALRSDYLQPGVTKDSVLKPLMSTTASQVPPLGLCEAASPLSTKKFYVCSNSSCGYRPYYVSDDPGTTCSGCKGKMTSVLSFLKPSVGGYVTGGTVSYMVMDNLEVKPMSAISGFTFIDKLRVKDISSVEQKEVQIGLIEGIALLEASLLTKTVLTTVFL